MYHVNVPVRSDQATWIASSYSSTRPSAYSHKTSSLSQSSSSPSASYTSSSISPMPTHSPSSPSHPQPLSSHAQTYLSSPPTLLPKPSSYQPQHSQQSFLTYFSSTTPDSPSKRARLKAVFMLSGSGRYDATRVLDRLLHYGTDGGQGLAKGSSGKEADVESVLALELAILYGKVDLIVGSNWMTSNLFFIAR